MSGQRVVVVEDDRVINDQLTERLRAEGYLVTQAFDGPTAVALIADNDPAVVLLDVMLPGFDGHEVCRRIQSERPVPVLMLTARDDEADVLLGLAATTDRALLTHGALIVDPGTRRTTLEGVEVHLTPTEFDLLVCLTREQGRVLTRERLLGRRDRCGAGCRSLGRPAPRRHPPLHRSGLHRSGLHRSRSRQQRRTAPTGPARPQRPA